jgi:hypothetical protein
LAINAADGDAVKPSPVVEDLVRPVLRGGMPCAPRQGPAGSGQRAGAGERIQVAAGSWQRADNRQEGVRQDPPGGFDCSASLEKRAGGKVQGAAGSWQHAEGTAEPSNRRTAVPLYCRTVEPSYCRTAVEHERNDRFRQRTIGDKNGRVLQTERRSPDRGPCCPLDHPARRGQPSLHGALRPPAGLPKNGNHVLARSRGFALNGGGHEASNTLPP